MAHSYTSIPVTSTEGQAFFAHPHLWPTEMILPPRRTSLWAQTMMKNVHLQFLQQIHLLKQMDYSASFGCEVRGQGINTPPGCADVTSSLAPVGVQGKTEAIAPRRRLPYPRTPRHHAPPRPRRNGLGGVRVDRRSLTPRSASTANVTPQVLPKDLKGGA